MEQLYGTLQSGVASLASYLAAHVLLCLVPAVFCQGAVGTGTEGRRVSKLQVK